MKRKRLMQLVTILIFSILLSPLGAVSAQDTSKQQDVRVNFTLDEELKEEEVLLKYLEGKIVVIEKVDGVFFIYVTDEDGNEEVIEISERMAYKLGYLDNVVEDYPGNYDGKDVEDWTDGKYVVIVKEEDLLTVKQVITKDEAEKIGYVPMDGKGKPEKDDKETTGKTDQTDQNETNKTNKTGQSLPSTATNVFNILLIGSALLAIGVVFILFSRKRKSETNE